MKKFHTSALLIIFFLTALTCIAQKSKPQEHIRKQFVGTWKLISIVDNDPNSPYREFNPTGYIMYDSTGHMAVQITRRSDRAKFESEEIAKATTEEKAAALSSYAAYYGTYTIDEKAGTVTHKVEGALWPNDVGKTLVRRFKLSGNRITLMPIGTNNGGPPNSAPQRSLTWEKVK